MKHNRILRTLFSVTGLLIFSKLLGFIKQMVTAAAFGTTLETDIINLAQGFIGNLDYLLVQALVTAIIPTYIHAQEREENVSNRFAFQALKAYSLITAVVSLLVFVFAAPIAKLLAWDYEAEASQQLASYLRLFAPVILLLVWTALFNALLHANKRFLPGEMLSVNQSFWVILLVMLLQGVLGPASMAVAFLSYSFWNAGYTAILSRRYWSTCSGNPFLNEDVRKMLRMMLPLLLGYSLVYVNQMVDKILVSRLEQGTVTALGYAAVLSQLVSTFISTFASIFFTYVTTRIAHEDKMGAAKLTGQACTVLLTLFTPVSLLTVLCAQDIVTIVYGRGAFDLQGIAVCSAALVGYALMFPPLVLREVYSRFLYGYQDSKRPMINSSIGIVCNILLSVVLCPYFGVTGVTFATSISVLVCGGLNLYSARHTHPELCGFGLMSAVPWIFIGCTICGVISWWLHNVLVSQGALVRFISVVLVGGGTYVLTAFPLLLRLFRQWRVRP